MGTKEGFGTYTWADASKFQGDWKDNKIDGKVRPNKPFTNIRVPIHGPMAEVTLVNGRIIICMDLEYIPGPMEDAMKENISMIRNTGSESTSGPMVGNI